MVTAKQYSEEQSERSTTTTTTTEAPPRDGARAASRDDGGGGGGSPSVALWTKPKAPEEPAGSGDEGVRLLTDFGVTRSKAAFLAGCHSVWELRAGIQWVRDEGRHADSRPGLFVTILGDGTARQALEKQRRAAMNDVFQAIASALEKEAERGDGRTAAAIRMQDLILTVWPTIDACADAGVLSDDDLLPPIADANDAVRRFNLLYRAARAQRAANRATATSPRAPAPLGVPDAPGIDNLARHDCGQPPELPEVPSSSSHTIP